MAIRDIFKVSRKTFINITAWIDYDGLKNLNQTIYSILKALFSPQVATRTETFEQAMERLQITEKDVHGLAVRNQIIAVVFLLFGLAVLLYAFYLLIKHGSLLDFILAASVAGLFFAYAFKYDFWAIQIKRRQLGMTFAEWKHYRLGK